MRSRSILLLLLACGLAACGPKRIEIQRTIGRGGLEMLSFPATGAVASSAFLSANDAILATWVETTNGASTGTLRFSSFDGNTWSTPVAIANGLMTADARSRAPVLSETPTSIQVLWFESDGGDGLAPRVAVSHDRGATWDRASNVPQVHALGAGETAFLPSDDGIPSIAWTGGYRSLLRPVTESGFIAHPRLHVDGFEETILGGRLAVTPGISALRFRDHTVVALREFTLLQDKDEGETNIRLFDIDPTGLTQETTGDHDGWYEPSSARGVGPVLATSGGSIAFAYYSQERKGFPAILVFYGGMGQDPGALHGTRVVFPIGVAVPVLGVVRDLRVHFAGDMLVVSAIEAGRLTEHYIGRRNFYSYRLGAAALPDSLHLSWAGSLGTKEYLAWSDGSRAFFARAVHGAPAATGTVVMAKAPPDAETYLGAPRSPSAEMPPVADADDAQLVPADGASHGSFARVTWNDGRVTTETIDSISAESLTLLNESGATREVPRSAVKRIDVLTAAAVADDLPRFWMPVRPESWGVGAIFKTGVHAYGGWGWGGNHATTYNGIAFELGGKMRAFERERWRVDAVTGLGYYKAEHCETDSSMTCLSNAFTTEYLDAGPRVTWGTGLPVFAYGQVGAGLLDVRYDYRVQKFDPSFPTAGHGSTSDIFPSAHALAGFGLTIHSVSFFVEAKSTLCRGTLPARDGTNGLINNPISLDFGGRSFFAGMELRR